MVHLDARPARPLTRPAATAPRAAGIALPLALLALAMVSLLAAGGFLLARLELRISGHHRTAVEAFYAADGALRTGLSALSEGRLPPADGFYPGWRVQVDAPPLLELPGGDRLLRVRARAEAAELGPFAAREVGIAALSAGPADPAAALTALAGAEADAGVLISGEDASSPDCPPLGGAVAGALVLEGGADGLGGAMLAGSPPLLEIEAVEAAAAAARLAWSEPSAAGPEGDGALRVLSESLTTLRASDSGAGLLWVAGDLRLEAGFRWEGLVVAGGGLDAAEDVEIRGGAVTGLSALAGERPGPARLGPGVEIRRASCAVADALSLLPVRTVALPGSWTEAF